MSTESYTAVKVTRPQEYVVHVEMNRPEKRNAMNGAFFRYLVLCICQSKLTCFSLPEHGFFKL